MRGVKREREREGKRNSQIQREKERLLEKEGERHEIKK